jgi:hypothetical protein
MWIALVVIAVLVIIAAPIWIVSRSRRNVPAQPEVWSPGEGPGGRTPGSEAPTPQHRADGATIPGSREDRARHGKP